MRSEETFEPLRRYLFGVAYRMLGSVAEAEDIVQEAWLRWHNVNHASIAEPRPYLRQTVMRLCMDHMKSARAQREVYVGPWLPEPLIEDSDWLDAGPAAATELASDLSYAFLLALETLSPLERAAFLLHDVFDEDFTAVASALGRSEAACRQLAARARSRVRDAKPTAPRDRVTSQRVAEAFMGALGAGDFERVKQLLAGDVRLLSDGGGRVAAAGIPLLGRDRVLKFLSGIHRKYPLPAHTRVRWATVNGQAGCLMWVDEAPLQTISLELGAGDEIVAIYIVRNPEKLRHLGGGRL
jgi:RNA polymerase sigma-70 factor (ECF subfamily)